MTTGANPPGIAMLARMAVARSPWSSTTILLGDHVGRDGAVGNRQFVEVRLEPGPRDIHAQQVLDIAGVDQSAGRRDAVRA